MGEELIKEVAPDVYNEFVEKGMEFVYFSFRWMVCFLIREFSIHNVIYLWDHCLIEGDSGFSVFHIYVCASFLLKWVDKIKNKETTSALMFLQRLPTKNWTVKDTRFLLADAIKMRKQFPSLISRIKEECQNH